MKAKIFFMNDEGKYIKDDEYSRNYICKEVTLPPDIPEKNGSHLDGIRIVLPNIKEPEVPAVSPALPSTLLEIRNRSWRQGIGRLGKAVGQLLASGYADYARSRNLLQHLSELAQVYDRLRQDLQNIPYDSLRLVDEEANGKK